MAATVYCPERYISWATRALWAVMTEGRPPERPRARAAASPAVVRSRIRSRSNSARAAKTWKTSLPPGVVVSIASCRLRNPIPRSATPVTVSTRCRRERPRRSSFHTTRVSPGRSWSSRRSRVAIGASPAGGLDKHSVAAGTLQGVDLELGVLVGGGDASIAEQMSHVADRLTTLRNRWLCDVDFGHGFWTPTRWLVAEEWRLSQKRSILDAGNSDALWRSRSNLTSPLELTGVVLATCDVDRRGPLTQDVGVLTLTSIIVTLGSDVAPMWSRGGEPTRSGVAGPGVACRTSSRRILGPTPKAGLLGSTARRSSTPCLRITSRSRRPAVGSTSRCSSTRVEPLGVVRVAVTRQLPVGKTSRLWLCSVHHWCPETSQPLVPSRSWSHCPLAGFKAMVRTGRSDAWWNEIAPTGGSASRWRTPKPCSRLVVVHSPSVRQASTTLLSAGSMVHVPGGRERDGLDSGSGSWWRGWPGLPCWVVSVDTLACGSDCWCGTWVAGHPANCGRQAGWWTGALVIGASPSRRGDRVRPRFAGHQGERGSPGSGDLRFGVSWRTSSRSRPRASISARTP